MSAPVKKFIASMMPSSKASTNAPTEQPPSSAAAHPPAATASKKVVVAGVVAVKKKKSGNDQQQQQRTKLHNVSGAEWLHHVRSTQMEQITPAVREELMNRVKQCQAVGKKMKASKNIVMRSKSAMYHQVECSKAISSAPPPPPQGGAGGFGSSRAPQPASNSNMGGSVAMPNLFNAFTDGSRAPPAPASASTAPPAPMSVPPPQQQQAIAERTMQLMDEADNEWCYTLKRAEEEEVGRDADDDDLREAAAEVAMVVDDSDIAVVLQGLQKEPATDDACAAKFMIYEKFSEKVATIRSALDEVVESALHDLPEAAKRDIRAQMKALDSAEHGMGIYDRSRYWFVHDMMQQASKNCQTMEKLSTDISSKLKMVAESAQDDCPICLRSFTGGDGDDDEDPCEIKLLSCCHAVCKDCWTNWTALRGSNASCPLCRHREFMEFLADPDAVA